MLGLLNNFKTLIENTYKVDSGVDDVSDCIISESTYRKLKKKIKFEFKDSGFTARTAQYRIGDDDCISLCFSDDFIEDFNRNNPRRYGINVKNFHLVRAMVEEMDHYILLAYSARHGKPMTWLEAELQADITEYLAMKLLIARQQRTFPGIRPEVKEHLKSKLFDPELYSHIEDKEIRSRYQNASRMARAFIGHLDDISGTYKRLMELRSFYRKTPRQKLEHIASRTEAIIV